jgi:hypothetical protein
MNKDSRTPLSEYTTDELRAELMKRRKKGTVRITKYLEWEGIVTAVHEWGKFSQFQYTVQTEDSRVPNIEREKKFRLCSRIKKSSRPRLGDRVVLRIRYTKAMERGKTPVWWSLGKIQRVISTP